MSPNPFASMASTLAAARKTVQPGDVFERLTVLEGLSRDKWSKPMRHCRCTCGKEIWTRQDMLLAGDSKSCGCLRRDRALELLKKARNARAVF